LAGLPFTSDHPARKFTHRVYNLPWNFLHNFIFTLTPSLSRLFVFKKKLPCFSKQEWGMIVYEREVDTRKQVFRKQRSFRGPDGIALATPNHQGARLVRSF
jgi:hypothetical protein